MNIAWMDVIAGVFALVWGDGAAVVCVCVRVCVSQSK